jgi:hypothetical protein
VNPNQHKHSRAAGSTHDAHTIHTCTALGGAERRARKITSMCGNGRVRIQLEEQGSSRVSRRGAIIQAAAAAGKPVIIV